MQPLHVNHILLTLITIHCVHGLQRCDAANVPMLGLLIVSGLMITASGHCVAAGVRGVVMPSLSSYRSHYNSKAW